MTLNTWVCHKSFNPVHLLNCILWLHSLSLFPIWLLNTFSSGLQFILLHLYSQLATLITVSLRKLKQFSTRSLEFIFISSSDHTVSLLLLLIMYCVNSCLGQNFESFAFYFSNCSTFSLIKPLQSYSQLSYHYWETVLFNIS